MEEDAGKNIHPDGDPGVSYVDHNRCGTPLLEIVSEPDLRSPDEAVSFVHAIREILRYLGVSDCNMEEASLRCDANINLWIRENGETHATPIAEIKNMNSFRSMRNALSYEVKRQMREWEERRLTLQDAGKTTRGWDEERGVTVLQRSKEEASDYRYFPEPDLKAIAINRAYVGSLRARVGELPARKRERFVSEYGLTEQDAENLSTSKALCEYFEQAAYGYNEPRRIANWILGEVKKALNALSVDISRFAVPPEGIRALVDLIDSGRISGKIAKEVFAQMADTGQDPAAVVEQRGLSQIADADELAALVDSVMERNPLSVSDYRSGKEKALKFLMGQVMRETEGQANPQVAMSLLKKKLTV